MSDQEKIEYGQNKIKEGLEYELEYIRNKIDLRYKYEKMLIKAVSWKPPTEDHENLKKFMVEQINSSIDFDCNTKYSNERIEELNKSDPIEIYEYDLERLKADLIYYQKELENERERTESSNKWILDLYKSIGIEYK